MMGQSAHSRKGSALLSTAHAAGRHEQAGVLAVKAAGLPLLPGAVPESLPLGGEVAVPRWDAEEEGVVTFQDLGSDGGDAAVFGRGVHLGQDFLREGFFDPGGRER